MPEFGPSSRDDDNIAASSGRLINCYRQPVVGQGRTRNVLKSVLGTETFADLGDVFFYGAYELMNDIYAAFGGSLYRIGSGGVTANLGTISEGLTDFSSNNGVLVVAANGTYYTVEAGAITARVPLPFTSVGSVDFGDQYTLYTERNGRRIGWSDLADPTTLPALSFATAEATDGDVIRGIHVNGRWVIFKKESREIWYNTNQAGADAWSRVAGGVRNIGLKAFGLVTRTDEALFWVGNDNIARITLDGQGEQKFSYPPVDTALAQSDATDCFYYEDEGQKHCVIRFSDRPAWVLDLATGEWHERAEGADQEAWSIRGTVQQGDNWRAIDNAGNVYTLTRSNADATGILKRTAISPTFYFPERASVDLIEIFARTGFSDLGRDAQMWIRLSRDGGATWGLEKWRSLGDIGDHGKRAVWRAQGLARTLTIEASISEPAEIPIWSDFRLEAA